jgi:hypothetical protein
VEVFPLVGSLGVSGEKAREHHLVETSANANAARCVENLNRYGVEPARRKAGSAEGETAQVQEAVGADPPPQLTQPCVIPQVTEGDEAERERYLRAVWRYIASDESIRTVFGAAWALRRVGLAAPPGAEGETPLLSRADTLVTGISEAARSRAVRIGAIEASLFDDAREANARGEISGHYFCHAEDAAACGEALQRINRRVVAPTITDYVACTDRAGRTRRGLGTMLLASESRKAEAVRAAVSHGAVGTLVIDEDLARAILGD